MIERKGNTELCGSALVLAGGAMWGIIGPFIQIMSGLGASPLLISFFRMAFSFLILFIFVLIKYGINALKVNKIQLFSAALLGLLCHGIYNAFYSIAVKEAGVTISAVLLNIAPLFTAIFAVSLFHEKMTKLKVVALSVNVCGCILAATGGKIDFTTFSVIGVVCGLGAGFCYSLTAILGKIAGEEGNVFVFSTYSYFFAMLFLLVFGKPWNEIAIVNNKLLLTGFLYALFPTVIAYLLYYKGVQLMKESSKVPVIASIEMIVAGIFGVLLFRERINTFSMVGIACVFISIVLMNKEKRAL